MGEFLKINADELKLKFNVKGANYCALSYPIDMDIYKRIIEILEYDQGGHIFISAKSQTNLGIYLKNLLKDNQNNIKVSHWCYVYNFSKPDEPSLLNLSKEELCLLEDELQRVLKETRLDANTCFQKKDFVVAVGELKKKFKKKSKEIVEELNQEAINMGFSAHITKKGSYFVPVIDGKKMSEKDYDELSDEMQREITEKLSIIEEKSNIVKNELDLISREEEGAIIECKKKWMHQKIDNSFTGMLEKEIQDSVYQYITDIKTDITRNLDYYIGVEKLAEVRGLNNVIILDEIFGSFKYCIKRLNKGSGGQDVSLGERCTYYDLFGKVVYKNDENCLATNHTLIEGGLLTRYHNGYMILNLKDIISNQLVYDKFKRCLINHEVSFDNIREQCGGVPIVGIRPEPVSINTRVILIGDYSLYAKICQYDNEFYKLFSHHIEVGDSIQLNPRNLMNYYNFFENQGLSEEACIKLLEFSVEETGNRYRLTTNIEKILKLIRISKKIAFKNKNILRCKDIDEGIRLMSSSKNYYKEYTEELLKDEKILMNVTDKIVGEVNGLAVTNIGDCSLARPIRITCTAGLGDEKIISIEDRTKISGKIFNKGMHSIKGFINHYVFEGKAKGYECFVCFEQVYGLVEGDSAMAAIVAGIISAFSNIPINQYLAVTGSMDQKGNIQPVGGVSDKIEGFYDACVTLGRTDKQGVIVPRRNYNDIILKKEIIQAMEEETFSIYLVDRIEEVIELLLDKKIAYIKNEIVKSFKMMATT